jgi:NifB/MoaA-like Fe-S oxidoreductase
LSESISGSLLQRLLVEAVREHNVLPLTGRCNLSCIFCSHRFNPPGTKAYSFNHLPLNTVNGLLKFLDPSRKIIIGDSATRLREGEPLTYPGFLPVIEKLRQRFPQTLIQFTTNGSLLNRQLIAKLAVLQPLEIILSVNSISVAGRKKLMADTEPSIIRSALEALTQYAINFQGSVVALPHITGFDDLEETLYFLDRAGARTIRLLLPGFTKLAPADLLPAPAISEAIYKKVEQMQLKLSVPLLTEPSKIMDLNPVISGVIKDSPADRAGLASGDIIMKVGNKKPFSRVEAYRLLADNRNPQLHLRRSEKTFSSCLLKEKDDKPGITVAYDLDPDQVDQVQRIIDPNGKNLMLLSVPALQRWQVALQLRTIANLDLLTVPSLWFGGTINCAGLLTVGDYRAAMDSCPNLGRYSRILLPSVPFDLSGYDICGEHYFSLSAGGLPVSMV